MRVYAHACVCERVCVGMCVCTHTYACALICMCVHAGGRVCVWERARLCFPPLRVAKVVTLANQNYPNHRCRLVTVRPSLTHLQAGTRLIGHTHWVDDNDIRLDDRHCSVTTSCPSVAGLMGREEQMSRKEYIKKKTIELLCGWECSPCWHK